MSLDRLASMAVFVRAVEAGSFRAASAGLDMSAQMVGEHVRCLEKRLGARLLQRTTRAQSLTEIGRAYFERCQLVLAEANAADALGADHAALPRGRLRISAPVTYGSCILLPVIAHYMGEYPDVQVDIDLSDRLVNLVDERYEAAFRLGSLANSSLIARKLADYRLLLAASPAYLQTHGEPQTPADLMQHACLTFFFASGASWCEWQLTRNDVVETVPVHARLQASDGRALVEGARAGLGVVMGPEVMMRDDIAAGRLVRLLPEWSCPKRTVHILFAPDPHQTRKLRSFIDFAAAALSG